MKIYEIVSEDLDEGKQYTIRDAIKILTDMGYYDTGKGKGSHNNWKHKDDGHTFPIAKHGKELEYGVSRNLDRVMRQRGYKPN
jgi:predicted RNA binding protein YcfA (HicA-like mRNA interferase family)